MNRLGHDKVRLDINATPEWLCDLVFEPAAGGTAVLLGYQVLKAVPRTLHVILRALLGVRDLRADLHQNMAASLAAIAGIAARQASGSPSAATARMSKSASGSQPRS